LLKHYKAITARASVYFTARTCPLEAYQVQLAGLDAQIEQCLSTFESQLPVLPAGNLKITSLLLTCKLILSGSAALTTRLMAWGVDGADHLEIGLDASRFPSVKHLPLGLDCVRAVVLQG